MKSEANKHAQNTATRFDNWASVYGEDRISGWFRFYQSLALNSLDLTQGSGFLDVGCGTGWAVREAGKRLMFGKVCGLDVSQKMIKKAKEQSLNIKNIKFCVGSVESLPYTNESFSSIMCTCSFHHYRNPVQALSEIRRVMRKDGNLVIIDSSRDVSLAMWLQDIWRRYFERSHLRYYKTTEMKALIIKAQLHLVGDIITIKKFMDHKKVFTGLIMLKCRK